MPVEVEPFSNRKHNVATVGVMTKCYVTRGHIIFFMIWRYTLNNSEVIRGVKKIAVFLLNRPTLIQTPDSATFYQ